MSEISPDPIVNESNKSVIASFELINNESGFWCTESFTISNRMSRLYEGSDGDSFIFTKVNPRSKSEIAGEQREAEGTSDI